MPARNHPYSRPPVDPPAAPSPAPSATRRFLGRTNAAGADLLAGVVGNQDYLREAAESFTDGQIAFGNGVGNFLSSEVGHLFIGVTLVGAGTLYGVRSLSTMTWGALVVTGATTVLTSRLTDMAVSPMTTIVGATLATGVDALRRTAGGAMRTAR